MPAIEILPPVAITPAGLTVGWPDLAAIFRSEPPSTPRPAPPPDSLAGDRARFVPLAGRLLLSAANALSSAAAGDLAGIPPERRGIALAIGSAVFDAWAESLDALDLHPLGSPGLFPFTLPNTLTTLVARALEIRGPSSTCSTCGPTASIDALAQAKAWLDTGATDVVCVGAAATGGTPATQRFSPDWPAIPEAKRRPIALLALARRASPEAPIPDTSRRITEIRRGMDTAGGAPDRPVWSEAAGWEALALHPEPGTCRQVRDLRTGLFASMEC